MTQCTDTQKEAIKVFLERTVRERHSVDELAKMIRPCIGLTKPQAQQISNITKIWSKL